MNTFIRTGLLCALTFVFAIAPSAQSADRKRDYSRALDLYQQGQYSEAVELVLTLAPTILSEVARDEANADFKLRDTRRLEIAAVMLIDAAGTSFARKDWRSSGNDVGARQVIGKLFAARVPEEPWTAYLRGQWRHFSERLDDARHAIK